MFHGQPVSRPTWCWVYRWWCWWTSNARIFHFNKKKQGEIIFFCSTKSGFVQYSIYSYMTFFFVFITFQGWIIWWVKKISLILCFKKDNKNKEIDNTPLKLAESVNFNLMNLTQKSFFFSIIIRIALIFAVHILMLLFWFSLFVSLSFFRFKCKNTNILAIK